MPRPLLYALGTFFWTGLAPIAPATVASFAFAAVWWLIWTVAGPIPLGVTAALAVVVTLVGIPIASALERIHGQDPSLVVIDEIAGMLVTFLGVTASPWGFVAGFFWFRFFDILKPFGVRRLEMLRGGGGLGIMADDVGAGALACAATHGTLFLLGALGIGL